MEKVLEWLEKLETPQTLTDELKQTIIDEVYDACHTAFNSGEQQGKNENL